MKTIEIEDGLFSELAEYARQARRSLESVVVEAIRAELSRAQAAQNSGVIPTTGGNGLVPGISLEDRGRLLDLMDGLDGSAGR